MSHLKPAATLKIGYSFSREADVYVEILSNGLFPAAAFQSFADLAPVSLIKPSRAERENFFRHPTTP